MKPEVVGALYDAALTDQRRPHTQEFDRCAPEYRDLLLRFASAIESHVRAEAFYDQRFRRTPDHEPCACCPEHWSAVDSAVKGGSDG
jgi:hypothetical protein